MKKLFFLIFALMVLPVSAQRPDAPSYALRGEYAVGTGEFKIEDENRPLDVALWYPTASDAEAKVQYLVGLFNAEGQAIRNAEPDLGNGPYPLIIFSHGSGGTRYQFYSHLEHLASYGFVVMAVDHPGNTVLDLLGDEELFAQNTLANFAFRPLDILRSIEFAETLNNEGDFAGLFDLQNLGVTGHSFGGFTALSVAGGALDFGQAANRCQEEGSESNFCQRIAFNADLIADLRGLSTTPQGAFPLTPYEGVKATVLLAPATGFSMNPESVAEVSSPTLIIVGSADQTTPPASNANITFQQLSALPRGLVTLENAGHFIFLEECPPIAISFGLYDSCSDKVWDMERAHDLVNHFSTAFFLAILQNDEEALAALEEPDFVGVDSQFIQD